MDADQGTRIKGRGCHLVPIGAIHSPHLQTKQENTPGTISMQSACNQHAIAHLQPKREDTWSEEQSGAIWTSGAISGPHLQPK